MSTEEQDQIIGRLVRERKERSQEIAAIEVKLLSLTKAFTNFGGSVSNNAGGHQISGCETSKILSIAPSIPEKTDLVECLLELQACRDGKTELDNQLSKFGL